MPMLAPDVGETIMQRVEQLAQISESPHGLTRRFATPAHRCANEMVGQWMQAAGMQVREDAIGNVIGRYEGTTPGARAVMLGSHLDTVVMAGRYDGMLGVLSGLACVEHLSANGQRLNQAIELIGFADEEGVRYQSTFLGSRALTGGFDPALLDRVDIDGISMRDALRAFGKRADDLESARRHPDELAAYLEVHIEQGPVLERQNLGVGVVTAIAGATRLVVSITGVAGHAGTVPMTMRKDALAAAANCITTIERICSGAPDTVGTVGSISAAPGAVNVIPGDCQFTVDIRSGDDLRRRTTVDRVCDAIKQIADARDVTLVIDEAHDADSVTCDDELRQHISAAIKANDLPVCELTSGAGHDVMTMASIVPSALIFVRCAGGISHHPAESVSKEDAALGAEVLMQTVYRVTRSEPAKASAESCAPETAYS